MHLFYHFKLQAGVSDGNFQNDLNTAPEITKNRIKWSNEVNVLNKYDVIGLIYCLGSFFETILTFSKWLVK